MMKLTVTLGSEVDVRYHCDNGDTEVPILTADGSRDAFTGIVKLCDDIQAEVIYRATAEPVLVIGLSKEAQGNAKLYLQSERDSRLVVAFGQPDDYDMPTMDGIIPASADAPVEIELK